MVGRGSPTAVGSAARPVQSMRGRSEPCRATWSCRSNRRTCSIRSTSTSEMSSPACSTCRVEGSTPARRRVDVSIPGSAASSAQAPGASWSRAHVWSVPRPERVPAARGNRRVRAPPRRRSPDRGRSTPAPSRARRRTSRSASVPITPKAGSARVLSGCTSRGPASRIGRSTTWYDSAAIATVTATRSANSAGPSTPVRRDVEQHEHRPVEEVDAVADRARSTRAVAARAPDGAGTGAGARRSAQRRRARTAAGARRTPARPQPATSLPGDDHDERSVASTAAAVVTLRRRPAASGCPTAVAARLASAAPTRISPVRAGVDQYAASAPHT